MAEQSPIDIPATAYVHADDIVFRYGTSPFTVVDDGYVLRADPSGDDVVEIDGHTYRLLQFHLHSPAEHTFAGTTSDMELHLVHADDAGSIAVVGVMLEAGDYHPALATLLEDGPARLDPTELLPADRAYVAYRGSLTTPPYAEGVAWHVLVHAVELSAEQLARFRAIHHGNARETQPLAGRDLDLRVR